MKHTLQTLRPRINRLSYLKTGNRIRTAIINEIGRCGISEAVIQDYIDRKNEVHERDVGEPELLDGVVYSPCDGLDYKGLAKPATWRAMDRKEVAAPKIEGLNYFPEDHTLIEKLKRGTLKPFVEPEPDPEPLILTLTPPKIPSKEIISRVASMFCITPEQLKSATRARSYVAARGVVVRLLREMDSYVYSFTVIAKLIGRTDHSTALHAWQNFDTLVKRDARVFEAYKALGGKMTKQEALNGTS